MRWCLSALNMWKKPWYLSQGPMLGAPCHHVLLPPSRAGERSWVAQVLWGDPHLMWHLNCLEMLTVFQALKQFIPNLRGHHVLVHTDNTLVVSYINRQGGLRSRPLCRLACQILLWAQGNLLSLRAVYIPEQLNQGADILLRQGLRPGEWKLHTEVMEQIWKKFGRAQVDLFASREISQCSLLVLSDSTSSTGAWCHGTDVAKALSVRLPPYCSTPGSSEESWPGQGSSFVSSPILAGPAMVCGPGSPSRRLSMGDSRPAGSPLTGGGKHSPPPIVVEAMGVAPEGAQLIASGLSTKVVETILQSKAPSMRKSTLSYAMATVHLMVSQPSVWPSRFPCWASVRISAKEICHRVILLHFECLRGCYWCSPRPSGRAFSGEEPISNTFPPGLPGGWGLWYAQLCLLGIWLWF